MLYTRHKLFPKSAFGICFLALVFCSAAHSTTFVVNSTDDIDDTTPGDGICTTSTGVSICTLRAAISESNALYGDDVIYIMDGTYTIQSSASNSNASGSFVITDGLFLFGLSSNTVIIDANNHDRAFIVQATGSVTLNSITIKNGNAGTSGVGGGILLSGSSLTVTIANSVISNNSANTGAGIGWGSPINSVTIHNTIIENNTGVADNNSPPSDGGGISASTGSLKITNSSIRNNSSQFGGGIETIGNLRLVNSTVSGNTATASEFMNNGFGGGGIKIGSGSDGSFIAINSTISNNKSLSSGAGILMVHGTAELYNTTVADNISDYDHDGFGYGGGISGSDFLPTPSISLINSLVADNTAHDGDGPDCWGSNLFVTSYGYNIIGNTTGCNVTATSGDLFGNNASPFDAKIYPLSIGYMQTHALHPGSPALDAGNPSGCDDDTGTPLTTDQIGQSRHYDAGSGIARCDIGAYEMNFVLVANAGDDKSVNVNDTVNMDASATQSSRGIASYTWTEIGASTVTLINSDTATPSFIAPATASTLTFELSITDAHGTISTDTVIVTVTDNASTGTANTSTDTDNSNSSGGGGAFDLFIGLVLLIVAGVREMKLRFRLKD